MSEPVALDVDFVRYFRAEYLAGRPFHEIGAEFGVSAGQVSDALPRYHDGREWRLSLLTPGQRHVAALASDGMDRPQIAAARGIGVHCVTVFLSQIRAAGYRLEVADTPADAPERKARAFRRAAAPRRLSDTTLQGRALLAQGLATWQMRRRLGITRSAASGIAFRLAAERRAAEIAARESSSGPAGGVSLFTQAKGECHGPQV